MAAQSRNIKALMEHGTQRKIARALALSDAYVSQVVAGKVDARTEKGRKTQRKVQVAVARALRLRVDEAFPQGRAA